MSRNENLHKAKRAKVDEFYSRYEDIEIEVVNYKEQLKGLWVYCPCDDYRWSNFWKYFYDNFNELGLKRLTATNYDIGEGAFRADYDGENMTVIPLEGNGDFRSDECVEFLKESDIVVTNPPFSLFRQFMSQLMEYGKKFIVIGPMNAVTYKEIFPLIKENNLWLGFGFSGGNAYFATPNVCEYAKGVYNAETGLVKFRNCHWFTNLDHDKRHRPIDLYKHYSNEYKHYDNYDAIEVSKVSDIPMDYDGVMGLPITFFDKYNPNQFEIVGMGEDNGTGYSGGVWLGGSKSCLVNGKATYARILIRHRK